MWETKVNISDTPSVSVYKTEQENVNGLQKSVIVEVACWDCRHALPTGGYVLVEPKGPHLSRACCIICRAIFR